MPARSRWIAAFIVALGCGPTPQTSSGGSAGEGTGGAVTGDADGLDASVSSAAQGGSEGQGDESPEPKYDLPKGPPPPTDACGYPVEPDCTPTWPPEEELAGNVTEAMASPGENFVSVTISPTYPDDATTIATLAFDMPCPIPAGAPKVKIDRFDVDAELTILGFGGFEWSLVGVYPAVVDVEFVNACVHLRVHGIDVGPEPLEPGRAPTFEWDGIIEPGFVYAPLQ